MVQQLRTLTALPQDPQLLQVSDPHSASGGTCECVADTQKLKNFKEELKNVQVGLNISLQISPLIQKSKCCFIFLFMINNKIYTKIFVHRQ